MTLIATSPARNLIANAIATHLLGWSPLSLFQSGEQGLAYDAMDLSSFYSDDALTTPCAVNATCGSLRDARALTLDAEAITNGNFTADLSGWTLTQTVTASVPSWDAGVMKMNSDGAGFSRADQSFTTTAGRRYRVTGIIGGNQQSVRVGTTQGGSTLYNGVAIPVGAFAFTFIATGTTTWIQLEDGSGSASSFDSVSVVGLPGNHAYQSTAANRPILRGTPTGANLVTNGDFATAANWTPGAGWAIGSGVATATASSAALTHTLAATSARVYRVRYTMTRSAGTLTPSFGGVTLTARSASDTYEEWITASSTAALVFTAAAFTGTLDDVAIHDCSADVVSAPYGLQMGTIAGVDRWMQTAAAFAHDSDWSVCVGIKSYAFADGVYPYGVATVRGGTSDTEGFILAVASGAEFRTRAYATETGFTNTLSAATPYVLLASKQQSAHVRTAWVSGQIEESDASAFATTPAATSNQSARFGLNYSTQFMPMIWYGGVLIGRELNASEKAQLRQWVSARTPGTTL